MMEMRLSCNAGIIEDATWADVEAALPELKIESFFRLAIEPVPESGPKLLEIQSENGNYMALMLVRGSRSYDFNNPAVSGAERIAINGYKWDPTNVTQDYDLIVRIIKEFYHTHNVSPELWEPQPNKSE